MQPVSNARSPLLPVFLLLCNLNAYVKTKQTKKVNQFLFECAPYSILMKKNIFETVRPQVLYESGTEKAQKDVLVCSSNAKSSNISVFISII